MYLLSGEWEAAIDPYISHFTSILAQWSPLKELVPNLHFIHSVLATGVKCFHVGPFHLPQSQEKVNRAHLF